MLALKHKVYHTKLNRGFRWSLDGHVKATLRQVERVRQEAEKFAAEVGAENVVSIVEQSYSGRTPAPICFTLTVWYREEQGLGAKPAPADEFFEAPRYR